MTKENESIRGILNNLATLYRGFPSRMVSDTTIDNTVDTALADIKRILKGKIKGMKWEYSHTACSCGKCVDAAYRNFTLDSIIDMVENLE